MNFVLKMAWRDSRASRRRLVLFSFSIVMGIAALVAIGSLGANLREAIEVQAKGLLGADLIVVGRSAPSPGLLAHLDSIGIERARETMFSSMAVFSTAADATRLVQVRAVEGNFPFYGDFVTFPSDAVARLRTGGDIAVVEETLLKQFGAKVGDRVKLGHGSFTIIGALGKIPGESTSVALLAPRVFIPRAALEGTGLASGAALMRHRIELRLPASADPEEIIRGVRENFTDERMSFDTVEERKRDLGRAFGNIQGFLSLVGFIALFLGAVGVAAAMQVYVGQKLSTVAVLRCLGATARQGFLVYLTQGLALGLFGAVAGAVLGVAAQLALAAMARAHLPFDIDFFLSWPAIFRAMAAGLVISLLFTLLPLLPVRRVSPLVALRSAFAGSEGKTRDAWRNAIWVMIALAVTGFAVWQMRSVNVGLGFAAALGLGFGILTAVAKGTAWAARRWMPSGLPYVARKGVANLHRPGNRTVLMLLSLGLGTFLVLTLFLARTTLLREIASTGGADRPNLLFFDIQSDQVEPFSKLVAAQGAPVLQQAAIVTMKIASIKGRPVAELLSENGGRGAPRGDESDGRAAGWTLRREYRSTFRGSLTPTEHLVAGNFVGHVDPGDAVVPISLEEGLFKEMELKLGDEIVWDVQGLPVRTRVGSVRSVEWRQMSPNFFAVFPEGVLESAPKFHVAALRAATADDSARLQRAVVAALPNVTAIDLALIMETIDGVLSKVVFAVQFMAFFTVATGIIVLAGAVMSGRQQRIRETVLLRTLGASRRQLTGIQFAEYAILGALSAVVGCALAIAANALIAHFVFDLPPEAPAGVLLLAVAAVMAVTLVTGLLANRGIASHPPLEVLRNEV